MVDRDAQEGEKKARPRRSRGNRDGRGGQGGGDAPESSGSDDGRGEGGDPRRRDRRRRGRSGVGGGSDVEELGASSGIDVLEIPSDRVRNRRPGGLEPGLTLKDLLPFLRPPKTVLVMGVSTGAGHNRTASALFEAFKTLDRNLNVRLHDALDLLGDPHTAPDVRMLLENLGKSPSLFGEPFETVEGDTGSAAVDALSSVASELFAERMNQVVVDRRPDHIVCTHWLPFRHLEKLKEEERLTCSVTAVIPETDPYPQWVSPVVEHYVVAEESVRARLGRAGVDPSRVSVTGIPVSLAFSEPLDREGVLRDLGLRGGTLTILLRPGGIGAQARIVRVASMLLEAAKPVNLLVVLGKNEALKAELEELDVPSNSALRVYGFVQNIHELMGVSDLLITRASPHTVAEACAAGLPAILLRPSSGIEERTADSLLLAGCARKANCEEDLEFLVRDLFANRRVLRDMKEALERRRRPDATRTAVERLAKIIK
jgi:processive 1,2-diacylglycerol beta-glucosyltransferase